MTRTILITVFCWVTALSHSHANVVKVIYFYPTDISRPDDKKIAKIQTLMANVQSFYRNEMIRHGYDAKTFRLETDENNRTIVHIVAGKQKLRQYISNDTLIEKELPVGLQNKFALKNDIQVIFLGGARDLGDAAARALTTCREQACTYSAVVPSESGVLMPQYTVHEVGHTFGLQHNNSKLGKNTFVMNTIFFVNNIPKLEESNLDDYEVRWLDRHKYFNQLDTINNPPKILKIHNLTGIMIENKEYIQFGIELKNDIGLHQAQISKGNSGIVVGWNKLQNREDIANFKIRRTELLGVKNILFQVIDFEGNMKSHNLHITLPEKLPRPPLAVDPNENIHTISIAWAKMKIRN